MQHVQGCTCMDATKKGFRYALKVYSSIYHLERELIDDARQAAHLAVIEAGVSGHESFLVARKAAAREIYQWINRTQKVGAAECAAVASSARVLPDPLNVEPLDISILSLARFFYAKLKKRGKRGRRSAAIKAWIVIQLADPKIEWGAKWRSGKHPPRYTNVADRSTVFNSHHHLTPRNAQQHADSAYALVFGVPRGNISRTVSRSC